MLVQGLPLVLVPRPLRVLVSGLVLGLVPGLLPLLTLLLPALRRAAATALNTLKPPLLHV